MDPWRKPKAQVHPQKNGYVNPNSIGMLILILVVMHLSSIYFYICLLLLVRPHSLAFV